MTNTTTAPDIIGASFVTIYPRKGFGRIHSVDCHRAVGAVMRRPTNAGALRNGTASIARCCASHESHMLALWSYVEASA
jgi:hypothetical protein